MNVYKEHFKFYKSGAEPPELQSVLDFNTQSLDIRQVTPVKLANVRGERFAYLKPSEDWQAFEVLSCPGLIYIKNPFTPAGQRYWVARCLRDYPKPPNKKNLDAHVSDESKNNAWDVNQYSELFKLRWITFGYHHNWDTKVYNEKSKSAFPADLNLMCKYISKVLHYPHFKPEAAIVNYYHLDSILCGHADVSERDYEAPLFSFSFGQSAIFLLGKNMHTKPTAMFLHSGDIVVMSKESRLYIHGIPRVMPNSVEKWNEPIVEDPEVDVPPCFQQDIANDCDKKDFWLLYENYLKSSRININVRQVLKRGQKRLLEK